MCPVRGLPFAPSFLPTPFNIRRHYLHFLSSTHDPTKTPIYKLAFSLPQNHDKISFSFSHSKFCCLHRSVVPFLKLSLSLCQTPMSCNHHLHCHRCRYWPRLATHISHSSFFPSSPYLSLHLLPFPHSMLTLCVTVIPLYSQPMLSTMGQVVHKWLYLTGARGEVRGI